MSIGILLTFGISVFCYVNCVWVIGSYIGQLLAVIYWICFDSVPYSALLWAFLLTDHFSIKWKRRRKEDLHLRSSCSVSRKRASSFQSHIVPVYKRGVAILLMSLTLCLLVFSFRNVLTSIAHRPQILSTFLLCPSIFPVQHLFVDYLITLRSASICSIAVMTLLYLILELPLAFPTPGPTS